MELTRDRLENLYDEWNRPEFVSPDPLETILPYTDSADREVAALLAASLAYGRVAALLKPLRRALAVLGSSPRDYVENRPEAAMVADLDGVVHRFARPAHLAALLAGTGAAVRRNGSLEEAFLSGYRQGAGDSGDSDARSGCTSAAERIGKHADRAPDAFAGLAAMTEAIRCGAETDPGHLLARPGRGSACKRLHLFLRWMVRKDAVDPGGWEHVDPARLFLPLDTWTHRIALRAGWTDRKASDARTVREIGRALSGINPEDPVKYDFALSRFGIRSGLDLDMLFDGGEASLRRLRPMLREGR